MASQWESFVGNRRFKLPEKKTNLRRLKPKSGQEGTYRVEKRGEVMMNISRDEGPVAVESGSRCDRPTTPSFRCHGTSNTWEEPTLIEEDVPLIRTKKRGQPMEEA